MYIRVSHTNVNIYKVWSVGSELTTRLAYIVVWICASRPARNNGTDLYISSNAYATSSSIATATLNMPCRFLIFHGKPWISIEFAMEFSKTGRFSTVFHGISRQQLFYLFLSHGYPWNPIIFYGNKEISYSFPWIYEVGAVESWT